jgi:hypothetical protein
MNLTVLLLTLASIMWVAAAADDYRLIKQIPIGAEGGWDFLYIDAQMTRGLAGDKNLL